MTKKEIKVIMEAINGCQGVIGTMVGDEKGMMTVCADTYYRLNRCWLYLRMMIEEVQE